MNTKVPPAMQKTRNKIRIDKVKPNIKRLKKELIKCVGNGSVWYKYWRLKCGQYCWCIEMKSFGKKWAQKEEETRRWKMKESEGGKKKKKTWKERNAWVKQQGMILNRKLQILNDLWTREIHQPAQTQSENTPIYAIQLMRKALRKQPLMRNEVLSSVNV